MNIELDIFISCKYTILNNPPTMLGFDPTRKIEQIILKKPYQNRKSRLRYFPFHCKFKLTANGEDAYCNSHLICFCILEHLNDLVQQKNFLFEHF